MTSRSPVPDAPPYYALRMGTFYAGFFVFAGVTAPFLPVWLAGRGLSLVEIGNIIALPMLARVLFTPLAGYVSDHITSRRRTVQVLSLAALIAFAVGWRAMGFQPLLLTVGLAMVFYGLALAPGEAMALTGVRRFGLDYGRMRLAGSASFMLATLAAGLLISLLSSEALFWMLAGSLSLLFAVSLLLPGTGRAVRAQEVAAAAQAGSSIGPLLLRPAVVVVLLVSGLLHGSHGFIYGFGSLEWQSRGFSGLEIGAFWAIGVLAEIVFLWTSPRLQLRHGPYAILLIGGVATVVRWPLYLLDHGAVTFALIQLLHGLTFGAVLLGTQLLLTRLVPEGQSATAQGLLAALVGIVTAIATAASGQIYAAYGALTFAFMSVPAAIAVGLLLAARRSITAEPE